ncbi:MAG: VWA domain-containing protein, partial [Candidatus Thorarchaeota archaeon]
MPDTKTEDTVILIDSSRSMLRKDFKPNRLYAALEVIKTFIHEKYNIDARDRIAIVTFGDTATRAINFSYDPAKLIKSFEKILISGKGNLHDGIAFSLQLLVEEMRKLGGKVHRILIISDNKFIKNPTIEKLINIAMGLGIYVDVCQLGADETYLNPLLKLIASSTKGQFKFLNNSKDSLNIGKFFASKKEFKDSINYFSTKDPTEIAPLINEIALPLRRPSVLDIRLMMSGKDKGQDKCQICHSIKAPLTQKDFFSEGRYCPSCDRPMHLSCAAMWAKKSEYKENVFRCPFCYFLLELPQSASLLLDEKGDTEPKIKIIGYENEKNTRMILVNKDQITEINASCTYCHGIF